MSALFPDSDSEDELPPAWEERATVDGNVYYVNHVTKVTQWSHPRTGKQKIVSGELPHGWERRIDSEGNILYIDVRHGRTTHSDPRLAFAKEVKSSIMDLRQRYDASTCATQILMGMDMHGKVALITGATNGIGFETARTLALFGAEIILTGRNQTTCNEARERILKEKPKAIITTLPMDLTSLASVQNGASQIKAKYEKLDIIILNAGIMSVGWQLTEDGFETVFQVNYLSQFYLIVLLESTVRSGSRIVIVSSESHRFSMINENNLSLERLSPTTSKGYWDMMAYNDSKLCNVLHVAELSRRLKNRGVLVMAVHPGNMISTGISSKSCFYRALFALVRPFTKSLQQGAATTIFCAVAPELSGCTGGYFNNCWFGKASTTGQNPQLARSLWDLSVDVLSNKYHMPENPFSLS